MKVHGSLTNSYKTTLNVEDFEYIADRTVDRGGENAGTSPHGLMLASVAACKTMVARGYLDHNDSSFEKIEVDAESTISGLRRNETIDITVELRVIGAKLTEKEERHLNQIVEGGCTMANILTAGGKNTVSVNIIVE